MRNQTRNQHTFDAQESRRRCLEYRRKILDISQTVQALHIGASFSCLEMVDTVYNGLMRPPGEAEHSDTFILSKGHGGLAQYVVLAGQGILSQDDLDQYSKGTGRLGIHPELGVPGIELSTGSLGHGLTMALGMALADKVMGDDRQIFVVMSDGELQEGSVWEAMMLAPSLGLNKIVALVDLNDMQSLGKTSETHPNFYPVIDKVQAFGWEAAAVNGHDADAVYNAIASREGSAPMMLIGSTVKGKGVSYMENVPIWHYRSPSEEEYQQAMEELQEVNS